MTRTEKQDRPTTCRAENKTRKGRTMRSSTSLLPMEKTQVRTTLHPVAGNTSPVTTLPLPQPPTRRHPLTATAQDDNDNSMDRKNLVPDTSDRLSLNNPVQFPRSRPIPSPMGTPKGYMHVYGDQGGEYPSTNAVCVSERCTLPPWYVLSVRRSEDKYQKRYSVSQHHEQSSHSRCIRQNHNLFAKCTVHKLRTLEAWHQESVAALNSCLWPHDVRSGNVRQ